MRTPDGRAFAGNDPLKAANRQRDKNIDVLNRRTQKQPKIPKPVVAGGGGVAGITRVKAWDITTSTAGDITFASPAGEFEIESLAGDGPATTQTGDGLTVESGYYLIRMDLMLRWGGSPKPTSARLSIDYSGRRSYAPETSAPLADDVVVDWAVSTSWSVGPLFIAAPSPISWGEAARSIKFGARWRGPASGAWVDWWLLDLARLG